MIIYFSATGNNKYLAQRISEDTDERCISIIECMKEKIFELDVPENESLGIIVPTYFLKLPSLVDEFFSKVTININEDTYVYSIASYGTTTGYALGYINEYLNDMKIKLDAEFEVAMPDTWTVVFDYSDKDKVDIEMEYVEKQLDFIIPLIKDKTEIPINPRLNFKKDKSGYEEVYNLESKTEHLHVLDNCISCGICAEDCPINAIELIDGKPVWIVDNCLICLRCLHRCPAFSIQYDDKTQDHGQYTNPHITEFD